MSAAAAISVLQVTPRFSPSVGGVETHVREIAARLPELGVGCEILTVDETGRLPDAERIDGIEVRRLRAYPSDRDWMLAPALPRVIAQGGWDVVHVQSYHTLVAPMAMMAAAAARVPFVLTFHGGGSSSRLRSAARRYQLKLLAPWLRRARALVAIADFEIREYGPLIGVPPTRFVKIPNGADLPPEVPAIPAEGKLVVSLGRLEPYKGHGRVLAAFPEVLRRVPDARLWIAGRGPQESELQREAQELGVAARVEIGAADRATLAGRLRGAAAMVLLSEFESHPLAVLEAASLGVPAVVAGNSGMAELAEQGLATAVELSGPPSLHAAAIVAAITGPRPAPRQDIPTWDGCASALAALYRSVR